MSSNAVVCGCIKELQKILLSPECINLFHPYVFHQFPFDLLEKKLHQGGIQGIPRHDIRPPFPVFPL